LPPARRCLADTAYDSDDLRGFLLDRGTLPVIPNNPTRKRRKRPGTAGFFLGIGRERRAR